MSFQFVHPSACLAALRGAPVTSSEDFLQRVIPTGGIPALSLAPDSACHVQVLQSDVPENTKLRHALALQAKADRIAVNFGRICCGEERFPLAKLPTKPWIRAFASGEFFAVTAMLAASHDSLSLDEFCAPLGGSFVFAGRGFVAPVEMPWEPRLSGFDTRRIFPARLSLLHPSGTGVQNIAIPVDATEVRTQIQEMLDKGALPEPEFEHTDVASAAYATLEGSGGIFFYDSVGHTYSHTYNDRGFLREGEYSVGMHQGILARTFGGKIELRDAQVVTSTDGIEFARARANIWRYDYRIRYVRPDTVLSEYVPQLFYYPGHLIEVENCALPLDVVLAMLDQVIRVRIPEAWRILEDRIPSEDLSASGFCTTRGRLRDREIQCQFSFNPKKPGQIWELNFTMLPAQPGSTITIRAYSLESEEHGIALYRGLRRHSDQRLEELLCALDSLP